MRRRDVLAGLASAGVIAGAGSIAAFGIPDPDSDTGSDDSSGLVGRQHEPYGIETVNASGSNADTLTVPTPEQPMFIDFFATWCDPCIEQMDALVRAHDRIGDEVVFLSVTNEPVDDPNPEAELTQRWEDNGGEWVFEWPIGLDPTSELTSRYWGTPYPSAVSIDASGTVQWHASGIKTTDELVAGIEQALEPGGQ